MAKYRIVQRGDFFLAEERVQGWGWATVGSTMSWTAEGSESKLRNMVTPELNRPSDEKAENIIKELEL